MSYNLLEYSWIPVLWTNGTYERVGIKTALLTADRIRQIAASNPMDRIAVMRFLLALLYWCQGNPPDEVHKDEMTAYLTNAIAKLEAHRQHFELLGDGERFYQDRNAQRLQAATTLLHEVPSGNNFWHIRHATDGESGICPACCVLGLLRLPLFSVSSLPNLKSGINGTPPIYAAPWGISLAETLRMNWIPRDEFGTPAWIQSAMYLTPGKDVPILTGLTLLSRRVWLHTPSEMPDTCIYCGTPKTAVIRTCEYQTAGTQENTCWVDPHAVYFEGTARKSMKATDLRDAGKFVMDRPWPMLLSRMIASAQYQSCPVLVVGFATSQALNVDVWERMVTIDAQAPEVAMAMLEQWWKGSGKLLDTARADTPTKKRKLTDLRATLTTVRPHVEHRVSANADALLAGEASAWEQAAAEYRPLMSAVAKSLAPGVTTTAVAWQRNIAAAAPAMEIAKKATKGK